MIASRREMAGLPLEADPGRLATLEWVLRVGAFLCFVGHGAFGVHTKAAWLPYFGVIGISPHTAYALMPLIGAVDIAMGCVMLVSPRPAIAWWMIGWACWTALLRPLSGEPAWETLERAGNYGVPAAFALLCALPRSGLDALRPAHLRRPGPELLQAARRLLTATVVLLLIGHGALGVLGKRGLVANYASVFEPGTAAALTPCLGWLEIALALAVALRPSPALLIGVAGWKLATESLFLTAGAPVWELVERGGSYAAPIALALLVSWRREGVSPWWGGSSRSARGRPASGRR